MGLRLKLLGLVLLGAACSVEGREPTGKASGSVTDGPLNLLLVTIDTLRADRLSCYGGPSNLTPTLDRLASEGVLFEQAVTPAPITLPAHASLFTGTYPVAHGVRDNSGFVLPPSFTTLAEVLREAGYQTGAFVGAFVLDSRFGLDQGFDTYYDDFPPPPSNRPQLSISEHPADRVLGEARAWVRARSKTRPWFAWIHLYDPHAPYQPPAGYRGRGDYEGEIAFVDAQLGRFFEFLNQQGHGRNTLILLTSDHGEGLGEHAEETHGMFLYETTLRVPLILRPPAGGPARRVATQVSLIDVMPTLLMQLGLKVPEQVQGRPLQSAWQDGGLPPLPVYAETLLPLLNYGWSDLAAIRTEDHKWVRAPRPELYDLQADPRELHNLHSRQPALSRELSSRLKLLEEESSSASANSSLRQPDAETQRRLRSLGYAGSNLPAASLPSDWVRSLQEQPGRADPKDKIEIFNAIWQAQGQAQAGEYREAVRTLDQVLGSDAEVFMAHSIRAISLLQLGQPREALKSLKAAVRLRPEDPGAHLYLGLAQQELGNIESAIGSFREAWKLDPALSAARNNLAAMLGRMQRFDEAARVFETMVREDPKDLAARLNLGGAYLMLSRHQDAERQLKFVEQAQPDIPELQNNLGLLYFRTGDLAAAEKHWLHALQLRPGYTAAHRNLAALYRRQGRISEAMRHEAASRGDSR